MSDEKFAWDSGDSYEMYVGRWSRLVAREFLGWLEVPPGSSWLDVGCGTGELAKVILDQASPSAVNGVDPSQVFIAYANEHIGGNDVEFRVGDAQSLQYEDGSFDATVSGLVLNFVPDAAQAVREMAKVTRPNGTVAAYVWDYAGEMQLMRHFWDAAVALDPEAVELDEGRRFAICKPEPLGNLFRVAGLHNMEVRAIDVPTVFRDFEDYWTPFLGGQAPAPGYCMSLDEARRAALRERIRAQMPIEADGSISLIARAWAVKGTV